jgi:hypothetical protein
VQLLARQPGQRLALEKLLAHPWILANADPGVLHRTA